MMPFTSPTEDGKGSQVSLEPCAYSDNIVEKILVRLDNLERQVIWGTIKRDLPVHIIFIINKNLGHFQQKLSKPCI